MGQPFLAGMKFKMEMSFKLKTLLLPEEVSTLVGAIIARLNAFSGALIANFHVRGAPNHFQNDNARIGKEMSNTNCEFQSAALPIRDILHLTR
jgi:hypothetical protein